MTLRKREKKKKSTKKSRAEAYEVEEEIVNPRMPPQEDDETKFQSYSQYQHDLYSVPDRSKKSTKRRPKETYDEDDDVEAPPPPLNPPPALSRAEETADPFMDALMASPSNHSMTQREVVQTTTNVYEDPSASEPLHLHPTAESRDMGRFASEKAAAEKRAAREREIRMKKEAKEQAEFRKTREKALREEEKRREKAEKEASKLREKEEKRKQKEMANRSISFSETMAHDNLDDFATGMPGKKVKSKKKKSSGPPPSSSAGSAMMF